MPAADRGARGAPEETLIDVGVCAPGVPLQAHQVTILKLGGSRAPRGSGSQIAANGSALAYSLNGGLVRAVNLATGGRSLLRSRAADVCSLKFCGPDVLCAASVDGTLTLQQLDLGGGTNASSRACASHHLLTVCLPPGNTRLCCSSTGLCAATTAGAVVLVDAVMAMLATESPDGEPATFNLSSLPECASVTSVGIGDPIDIAFSPSGGMLAVLARCGDVFVSDVRDRSLGSAAFAKLELEHGKPTAVDSMAWAGDRTLVCALDNSSALYLGVVLQGGDFDLRQRVEIASPSPLRLVSFMDGDFVALCSTTLPLMLQVQVDAARQCISGTASYSLAAPVLDVAIASAADNCSWDAFVVDALGVSRCTIAPACGFEVSVHDSMAGSSAAIDRQTAAIASHFDEMKRLLLQSRAEVDEKLHAQGVVLRRVLAEELRECVRSSLAPRLDRALGEAFGQMEMVLSIGVEHLTSEAARSFGLVDAMARRHEQMMTDAYEIGNRGTRPGQNNDKHSTRDQIRGLVASQRFEAAFSLALGNSDVELLAWLCSQLRPEDVFSSSAPMGQEVVLSLAQQLGCDLHNDPSTKAVWIRDAVLALDCTDPVLMPHIQAVLSELYAQLESEASSCDSGAQSELRLCMRVIKTQLRD